MRRFRAAVVSLAVVLLAAACSGTEPSGPGVQAAPAQSTPGPARSAEPGPEPTPEPSKGGLVSFEVWFTNDGLLAATTRTRQATPRVGTAALEALLAGPSGGDGDVATAVPAATRLLGLEISGGVATVGLSSQFVVGGSPSSRDMRTAQVVFTLTQFPTVRGVKLEVDGRPVAPKPLTRADFEDVAPPILVDAPSPGATVSSPVTVAGTANVFEATVTMRVLDARGRELVRTFTTATCGTGCRGDYTKAIRFAVDEEQRGFIEVFEESAEDGSPLFVVRIPVTLLP